MHEGGKHAVLYARRKLILREQNYSVGERGALAIISAVKKVIADHYATHKIHAS